MVEWTGMSAKYTVLPLGELYALGHGDLFITAEDLARPGGDHGRLSRGGRGSGAQ